MVQGGHFVEFIPFFSLFSPFHLRERSGAEQQEVRRTALQDANDEFSMFQDNARRSRRRLERERHALAFFLCREDQRSDDLDWRRGVEQPRPWQRDLLPPTSALFLLEGL